MIDELPARIAALAASMRTRPRRDSHSSTALRQAPAGGRAANAIDEPNKDTAGTDTTTTTKPDGKTGGTRERTEATGHDAVTQTETGEKQSQTAGDEPTTTSATAAAAAGDGRETEPTASQGQRKRKREMHTNTHAKRRRAPRQAPVGERAAVETDKPNKTTAGTDTTTTTEPDGTTRADGKQKRKRRTGDDGATAAGAGAGEAAAAGSKKKKRKTKQKRKKHGSKGGPRSGHKTSNHKNRH